jgi:hypothetical protein
MPPTFDFKIRISDPGHRPLRLPRTFQVLAITILLSLRSLLQKNEAILGVSITPLNPPYLKGEMQRVTVLTSDF